MCCSVHERLWYKFKITLSSELLVKTNLKGACEFENNGVHEFEIPSQ